MHLEKLQVQGIRNLNQVDISLSPGVNLFFGLNGSGKTSLLEAVHLLSRGRSFRSRNLKTVINFESKLCTCYGLVHSDKPDSNTIPVGVQRDDQGKFIFKVNGRQVTTASRLAEVLPVQVVNADSFQLLEGAPGNRRGFIDWGVFHVEHRYRDLWSRFQKCLKHRNSLLRHAKIDGLQLAIWNREFSLLACQIDEFRRRYLDELIRGLHTILPSLDLTEAFDFSYQAGWDREQDLSEQLERSWPRDRKAGYTHLGPHRADLKIVSGGQLASDVLSRGQTKSLVFALKLAQGRVFWEKTDQKCIFLLDDLPSELDEYHRAAVSRLLSEMEVQVLVTGVERRDLEKLWPVNSETPALFHVEHGGVTRIEAIKG